MNRAHHFIQYWINGQWKLRLAYASDQCLRCPLEDAFYPWLLTEWPVKTLIRLRGRICSIVGNAISRLIWSCYCYSKKGLYCRTMFAFPLITMMFMVPREGYVSWLWYCLGVLTDTFAYITSSFRAMEGLCHFQVSFIFFYVSCVYRMTRKNNTQAGINTQIDSVFNLIFRSINNPLWNYWCS